MEKRESKIEKPRRSKGSGGGSSTLRGKVQAPEQGVKPPTKEEAAVADLDDECEAAQMLADGIGQTKDFILHKVNELKGDLERGLADEVRLTWLSGLLLKAIDGIHDVFEGDWEEPELEAIRSGYQGMASVCEEMVLVDSVFSVVADRRAVIVAEAERRIGLMKRG